MYSGFGQDQPPLQAQLDCLAQSKWWLGNQCLSAAEFAGKVCAEQLGGEYVPATGSCVMKAQTGLSEAAQKAGCEAVGGQWNAEARSCALPTGPTAPPGPPSKPPAQSSVPWGALTVIGLGLGLLYQGFKTRAR